MPIKLNKEPQKKKKKEGKVIQKRKRGRLTRRWPIHLGPSWLTRRSNASSRTLEITLLNVFHPFIFFGFFFFSFVHLVLSLILHYHLPKPWPWTPLSFIVHLTFSQENPKTHRKPLFPHIYMNGLEEIFGGERTIEKKFLRILNRNPKWRLDISLTCIKPFVGP